MVAALVPGGARAVARCDALRLPPFSDMAGALYRAYLTPAHRAAIDQVGQWMVAAGMAVTVDPAANLIGRYEGEAPDAPALIIGSHIDSVRDAGAYDGPLGIMLGIELIAALAGEGRRLPFAIEVYAFGDEEGSRFPAAMLTSRAVAGTLEAGALDLADGESVTLAQALAESGADIASYHDARRTPAQVLGYLEAHIEQGPVLEARGLALGTVTGIAAQLRYEVRITGQAGHAGTTSMALRRDALAAAAEMVLAVEQIAQEVGGDVVATVGWIEASPGAPNVIAGQVVFSLDIRSGDEARRDDTADRIRDAFAAIGWRRPIDYEMALVHDLPASPCDPALMELMDAAIVDAGQEAFRLVSGAGHDAMVMAALCPTAMLFIRCRDGISHNPAEHVDPADAELALQALLRFIHRLGATIVRP
jgi:allantoate deiminase